MLTAGRADFYLPQGSKLALFLFAIVVGFAPGVQQGFFGGSVMGVSGPLETFGVF